MVWIAKFNINKKYKKGTEVPTDKALLWNSMYVEAPCEEMKKEDIKQVENKVNLDLNNDGKVDKKDGKIASKVMNAIRKKKGKK